MAFEDFTNAPWSTTGGRAQLVVTTNKVQSNAMDTRTEPSTFVSRPWTIGVGVNFEHLLEINQSIAKQASTAAYWWAVGDTLGDVKDMIDAVGSIATLYLPGIPQVNIYTIFRESGSWNGLDSFIPGATFTYYPKISYDADGGGGTGRLTTVLYTDSGRTVSDDTLVSDSAAETISSMASYMFASSIYSDSVDTANDRFTGYIANLDLQEAAGITWKRLAYDDDLLSHQHSELSSSHFTTVAAQNNLATGGVTIVFDTEIYDEGNNFAANTFTAPVDGIYNFSCLITLLNIDTVSTFCELRLITSDRSITLDIFQPSLTLSSDGLWFLGGSTDVYMDANDTAYVEYLQSGGAAQADIQVSAGATRPSLSVHLVG